MGSIDADFCDEGSATCSILRDLHKEREQAMPVFWRLCGIAYVRACLPQAVSSECVLS